MPRAKAHCDELLTWLANNLGRGSLGALTGTDYKALAAAAHLLQLYAYTGSRAVLEAFRITVLEMQPSTQQFAYHAIAWVSEWENRAEWWQLAGLASYPQIWILKASPENPNRFGASAGAL